MGNRKKIIKKEEKSISVKMPGSLLNDICSMIEKTRSSVAVTVNAGLTILYWRVGQRL